VERTGRNKKLKENERGLDSAHQLQLQFFSSWIIRQV